MAGQTCPCTCHPHTQWGMDGSVEQRENHPDESCCACCPMSLVSLAEISAEGFFASEQEAIAEEAAWADQMEQEAVVPHEAAVMTVDAALALLEGPAEGEEDAPVDPLDIPDHYDLPMYGSIIACPKCGNEKVNTQYHPHGVLSEPCGTRFGWPNIQNLGEHLCRKCTRCRYGWPEEVASGA